jgi:hypothetical protein
MDVFNSRMEKNYQNHQTSSDNTTIQSLIISPKMKKYFLKALLNMKLNHLTTFTTEIRQQEHWGIVKLEVLTWHKVSRCTHFPIRKIRGIKTLKELKIKITGHKIVTNGKLNKESKIIEKIGNILK